MAEFSNSAELLGIHGSPFGGSFVHLIRNFPRILKDSAPFWNSGSAAKEHRFDGYHKYGSFISLHRSCMQYGCIRSSLVVVEIRWKLNFTQIRAATCLDNAETLRQNRRCSITPRFYIMRYVSSVPFTFKHK
jgi:hypothetical protein